MRQILLVFACGISGWAQSNAVTSIAYGPLEFTRPSGAPIVQTAQFTFQTMVDGPYSLVVVANPSGKTSESGTITLNGTVVFGPGRLAVPLQKQVTLISPSVGQNTLQVELEGAPGASIYIGVAGYAYAFAGDYSVPGTVVPNPDDIDWRSKGAVTVPKNQGSNAVADWAFSATGVVEGAAVAIFHRALPSLSEQQLLDCTPSVSSDLASSPVRGLLYLMAASQAGGGADAENAYPYTGLPGQCRANPANVAATVSSVTVLPPGESPLGSLVSAQPVSAVINGNWMSGFAGGCPSFGNCFPITTSCGTAPPEYRAVLVVGQTASFWVLKNSLGTGWGNLGYFLLLKGKNACGINNYLSVAQ